MSPARGRSGRGSGEQLKVPLRQDRARHKRYLDFRAVRAHALSDRIGCLAAWLPGVANTDPTRARGLGRLSAVCDRLCGCVCLARLCLGGTAGASLPSSEAASAGLRAVDAQVVLNIVDPGIIVFGIVL